MERQTLFSPTRRSNTAMLGIAAVVLMVVVGLSYRDWRQYHRANVEAARTRQIVDAVDRLLSSLLDAETGQRGFLLTGENRYLEPYNRAVQTIPAELAAVRNLTGSRPGEAPGSARLDTLVDLKLAELRQTIEVRREQGAAAATAMVLGGRGKQTMDEIREVCAQIRRHELSSEGRASAEGEAAARAVLLVTIAAALLLLVFFAIGFEPFIGIEPRAKWRPWPLRYGAAMLAVGAAFLMRAALTPFIGPTAVPFITFFPAVLFAGWFGGFRAGALAVVLSTLASDYFFVERVNSFVMRRGDDLIALVIFVLVGFGMALLGHSQRHAVQRAEQERQRFETTLGSIGDAVIVTDADGRVTLANNIALTLMGCTESEVAGRALGQFFRIVNEFTRAAVEIPVAKVLREGAVAGLANHTVLIARDGTEVPIDDSAAPIRSASGTVLGAVLVFRDISGRRKTEEALRRSHEELRAALKFSDAVLNQINEGIFTLDSKGLVTYINPTGERLFGWRRDELLGRKMHEVTHYQHRDGTPFPAGECAGMRVLGSGNALYDHADVFIRKDGTFFDVVCSSAPMLSESGDVEGLVVAVHDVTGQRSAEAALREVERRYELAVEAAPNGMAVINERGDIVLVNATTERLFGYTKQELVGKSVEMLVPERFRKTHETYRRAFLGEPRSRPMGAGRDLYGLRKDGSEFPIEVGLSPIESNARTWVLSAIVDITERKRAEEQRAELLVKDLALASEKALRETEAELARMARALSVGELATSIAHEINQPLAGVVTNAQAGLRWLDGDSPRIQEARESLSLIVRDGNRASAVVQRIREFLRKERRQTESLNINEVIQEAANLAQSELLRRQVTLRTALSDEVPRIRGDRIQLQQVILNLIMNGAEAMASVRGPKEMVIRCRRSASDATVAVQDCGIGMNAHDMARMFDPLFTTKPTGIGMGLSISRSIIEAHGGRILAEPNPGPGLTVRFEVPVEAAPDGARD